MRDDDRDASIYAGFRCHFDKEVNAYVFATPEERDRWQLKHHGHVLNAFALPGEHDARPSLSYRQPFWTTDEQRRYERAVHVAPPKDYGSLDAWDYLSEVAVIAGGLQASTS